MTRIYCKALGYTIDPERTCIASESDLYCSGCKRTEEFKKLDKKKEQVISASKPIQEGDLQLKLEVFRKRICKRCGKPFRPKSNHQEYCRRCGKENEILRNRERQARFQSRHKNGLRLTV